MVRLVKGAYWDTEIKAAQVAGLPDYPVFTRKVATDVSYLACAKVLLAAKDAIYPAFATHNANTIAAVKALAGKTPFEFQRLHGMGEALYDEVAKLEEAIGDPRTPVRIYAPVGSHKELLAYLVRRLLENGANSSFVNRIADEDVSLDDLVRDPVADLEALEPKRNPKIVLPQRPLRRRAPQQRRRRPQRPVGARAVAPAAESARKPQLDREAGASGRARAGPIVSPHDHRITVGTTFEATADEVDRMVRAGARRTGRLGRAWRRSARAACSNARPTSTRSMRRSSSRSAFAKPGRPWSTRCSRCARRSISCASTRPKRAVSSPGRFRFRARPASRTSCACTAVACSRPFRRGISRSPSSPAWSSAPLAAGNAVIAKPAGQTPLIGALAIELMHQAGIPKDIVQLAPGSGRVVGGTLTAHPLISGVVFTGSTETARMINRTLAERDGPIIPFIAETGGQNAMIVDSSALPEQVTRDVISSAFQSAGQRCSALRVLFVQEDVADGMIEMIAGAMEALEVGDPRDLTTDVGPVIDEAAKKALDDHLKWLDKNAKTDLPAGAPKEAAHGCFVAPAFYEIKSLSQLNRENFGPILHVVRFAGDKLGEVVDAINATGYGLTLGLQSRIDTVRDYVEEHARVGNFYVNRNQIGAVVESQPFGGEGLSGTGPKAGGPHYVARFATERVTCIDTTAAGGNATLMAAIEG